MLLAVDRADGFLRSLSRSRCGVAAVEFALVLPVLSFMVIGLLAFGAALTNYVALTEGVRAAARVLAQSSAYPTVPYSTAQTFFDEATAGLNQADLTLNVSVNATQCTDDTSCSTALNDAAGEPVTVSATYSLCVVVMGHNFLPNCQLSASTTQVVE